MTVYVWRNSQWVDKHTGEPMHIPDRDGICTPLHVSDIEPYRSPVDGSYVSGRKARRDDLRKHGCVEYEPSMSPTGGKFRNARFAKKWGVEVSEEFRD